MAFTLAIVLFPGLPARGGVARRPTLESIGNKVLCTCGCNAPLNQCPMVDCAEKAQERAFIQQEIAAGKDETAILQDVALRYGLRALAAPPAKGFNLTVWILPGVGLLLGFGIVVVMVRRWKGKPVNAPASSSAALDPKLLSAVEEEMKSAGMR